MQMSAAAAPSWPDETALDLFTRLAYPGLELLPFGLGGGGGLGVDERRGGGGGGFFFAGFRANSGYVLRLDSESESSESVRWRSARGAAVLCE